MRILRTGVGSPPSEGVIQSLLQCGCKVIVADADKLSYGLAKHGEVVGGLICGAYVIPYAKQEQNFINAVYNIVEKEKIDAVIPAVDEELYPLAKSKGRIPAKGMVTIAQIKIMVRAFFFPILSITFFQINNEPTTPIISPPPLTKILSSFKTA